MATLWEKVGQTCHYVLYELADERTRDSWPSFGAIATILISYIFFCLKLGPAWMKDRKPYDLTNVIFYYNVFQIIISTFLAYSGFAVLSQYNWVCQPVSYEDTPNVRWVINLGWIYLNLKFIELLDTVFFVLRKKDRQISSLHLYHHFMMPICTFLGYKYYPNGHSISLGVINSFVHMLMYTYYLIAGMGSQYQKYLWWKKHVTTIQLIQFVIVFFHNLVPLVFGCNYPRWINVTLCFCSLHFVYMFGNFYYVNYIKSPSKPAANGQKVD